MKLDIKELNEIIVCPNCKEPLALRESADAVCDNCSETYRWTAKNWHLIPSSWKASSDLWTAWEQLQENGLISYTQDPENNLGVGKRQNYLDFGRFSRFDGLVLDVGCGPQSWPTHFTDHSEKTRFVGVDPLIGETSPDYTQLRALGEYLPFPDKVFDHVVFATSLDHFIDPVPVLIEASRVCRDDGEVNIWIGEKRPGAPKPAVSPSWYANLKQPSEAEDRFHLKRLSLRDMLGLIERSGLLVSDEEIHQVDEFRTNYFYRLKVKR
jgi:SAM-dependent methyltransferase